MDPASMTSGYLEIIIGPMFSGKTSKLLEVYKQCKYCNISVVVIDHSSDTRYTDTMLSTHDRQMIPCIQTSSLAEAWRADACVQAADVVLINEGQFFDELYQVVVEMLDASKKIYISGLDGDFQRKKFGQILDLVPMCDKVSKLKSLCGVCKNGQPAIFSKRTTTETTQTLVGVSNYTPVCRKCYSAE